MSLNLQYAYEKLVFIYFRLFFYISFRFSGRSQSTERAVEICFLQKLVGRAMKNCRYLNSAAGTENAAVTASERERQISGLRPYQAASVSTV